MSTQNDKPTQEGSKGRARRRVTAFNKTMEVIAVILLPDITKRELKQLSADLDRLTEPYRERISESEPVRSSSQDATDSKLESEAFDSLLPSLLKIVEDIAARGCEPRYVPENVIRLLAIIERADGELRERVIEWLIEQLYLTTDHCAEQQAVFLRDVARDQDSVIDRSVADVADEVQKWG